MSAEVEVDRTPASGPGAVGGAARIRRLTRRIWGLRRPRRLISVLARRLGLSHFLVIRTAGVRLRFFPAVWTTLLWEDPDFFRRDTALLRRVLRPGDTVVDCGANVGLLTLVAAHAVGSGGRVHAIEAHPRTYTYLRENIRLNAVAQVTCVHAAVGDRHDVVAFSDQETDDGNHVDPAGRLRVPMVPLDAVVPGDAPIRLLKLDVEGFEKFALDGAHRLLRRCDLVYFESAEALFRRYGYGCTDVFDLLRTAGMRVFELRGDCELEELTEAYVSTDIENLLAVRDVERLGRETGLRLVCAASPRS